MISFGIFGLVLLGFFSFCLYAIYTIKPHLPLAWQFLVIGVAWLGATSSAWLFLHRLPVGLLEFDGSNWYFSEKLGVVSVRFDAQRCLLLRFEDEYKQIIWLWLESRSDTSEDNIIWHDLRCAVYSRPVNTQYLSTP